MLYKKRKNWSKKLKVLKNKSLNIKQVIFLKYIVFLWFYIYLYYIDFESLEGKFESLLEENNRMNELLGEKLENEEVYDNAEKIIEELK